MSDSFLYRVRQKYATITKQVEVTGTGVEVKGLPKKVQNTDAHDEKPDTEDIPQGFFAGQKSDEMVTGSGDGPEYK